MMNVAVQWPNGSTEKLMSRKSFLPSQLGWSLSLALCVASFAATFARAEESPAADELSRQVAKTLQALDDEDFSVRSAAAVKLEQWSAVSDVAPVLSELVAAALLSPQTTSEVRARLEVLARQLPAVSKQVAGRAKAEEVEPLLEQLDSNQAADRISAVARLRAMLDQEELIGPVWLALKRRVADPKLTAESRRMLVPLIDQARYAWLTADPVRVALPPPDRTRIEAWIADVTRMDDGPGDELRRAAAERELLDLIVRDETRGQTVEALERAISATLDPASATTLRHLADFSRPGLAAEVWQDRHHRTIQYLLCGVPQNNSDTRRATHFSDCNEHTAHCVSGNSLTPGDYPVGVAIPHPDPNNPMMFHLTNLPTPRRRLIYEHQVKRDEAVRLREITQRTAEYFLRRKTSLRQNEVIVLTQLDPHAVSSFVGPYFEQVRDEKLTPAVAEFDKESSVHAAICYVLRQVGTHEAVPALEKLARGGRLEEIGGQPAFQIAWIAALSIAERDPWLEVDNWLLGLIEDTTPLASLVDAPPQLGPSAAALLLDRHGLSPRPFGLGLATDIPIGQFRFSGYRYQSPERNAQDVRRWWAKQQAAATRNSVP